jgi:glycosyltransferase involved in cell wall biosynthesis
MSWSGAPRVSVLLPVRNGGACLREALTSILGQTFADFELIVINDGSTDGSRDIAIAASDPRIVVIDTPGCGIARALNTGLRAARGELIARQDADDLSAQNRFEAQVAQFNRDPDLTLVTSRVAFIDDRGVPVRTAWTEAVATQWESAVTSGDFDQLLPQTCCLVHGSVMVRRDAMAACGGYDEALAVAQDYDLWLRLLPHSRFFRLPDRLYSFRIHGGQLSATRNGEQARQAIAAKLRYLSGAAVLPVAARARIIGTNGGERLYRDAIQNAGWSEVSGDADVMIFTDFDTLDRDIAAALATSPRQLARVGNFLVSAGSLR